MRAVIVQEDRSVKVEERPQPTISAQQILIKNTVLGQNPSDWKHAAFLSPVGAIMGVDAVGTVCSIGSGVPAAAAGLAIGQRRGLFMRGGMQLDNGPFAEYTAMDWDLTFAVPDNITDEEAATLPAPYWTAVQCLYHRLHLPEPQVDGDDAPNNTSVDAKAQGRWLLVWSGMSSVAQFVIQLAKLSGCKVITTASPSRWAHLKELGADVCIDYKDEDVVSKLKQATNDSITMAVDCFGEASSQALVYQCFSNTESSRMVPLLPTAAAQLSGRDNVQVIDTVLYTALGTDDVWLGPFAYKAGPDDRAHHARWLVKGPKLIAEGLIRPLKPTLMVGGMDQMQEGFVAMAQGQTAGQRLVYRV